MKTSNKIIIAITIIILGSILTLFSTSKLHEKFVKDSIVWETSILQPFTVVVAEDSSEVDIHKTSKYETIETNSVGKVTKQTFRKISAIDVETNKLKPSKIQVFKQNGDTLFLYKGSKMVVHSSTNIKAVIGKKHLKLELIGFKSDSINFNLHGGDTYYWGSSIKITNLNINVCDCADVWLNDLKTAKLNIVADKSTITIEGVLESISGSIKDNSQVSGIGYAKEIKIKRDYTSSFK